MGDVPRLSVARPHPRDGGRGGRGWGGFRCVGWEFALISSEIYSCATAEKKVYDVVRLRSSALPRSALPRAQPPASHLLIPGLIAFSYRFLLATFLCTLSLPGRLISWLPLRPSRDFSPFPTHGALPASSHIPCCDTPSGCLAPRPSALKASLRFTYALLSLFFLPLLFLFCYSSPSPLLLPIPCPYPI